ncbi:MAG: hypothetical protein ACFE95_12410 [Candidatus Hodarchaeota archaeon]
MKIEIYVLKQLTYLNPYIYYRAKTGSVYIKFLDERIGSIRIGNHDGIGKYKYRWNLRKDLSEVKVENDRGVVRYYYPLNQIDQMVTNIKRYHRIHILGKISGTRKFSSSCLGVFV